MGAAALTALCQGVCSVYCSCIPYRPQQSTICFAVTDTHTHSCCSLVHGDRPTRLASMIDQRLYNSSVELALASWHGRSVLASRKQLSPTANLWPALVQYASPCL